MNEKKLRLLFVIIAAASVGAMLAARHFEFRSAVMPFTMVASTAFVASALCASGIRSPYGFLLLAGLALCWTGDLIGPGNFQAGALAFLCAHLAFIAAFLTRTVRWADALIAASAMAIVTAVVYPRIANHVQANEVWLIQAYMLVIGAMTIAAAATARRKNGAIALVGAVVFYTSDYFVARWAYVDKDPINAYFCYPLYYTACLMLGFSVPPKSSASAAPALLARVPSPPGE